MNPPDLNASPRLVAASAEELLHALGAPGRAVQRSASDRLVALLSWSLELRRQLEAAVQSGSVHRRWGALFTLTRRDGLSSSQFEVFAEFLGSSDSDIRWACRTILVNHCTSGTFRDLLAYLSIRGSPVQRRMVLYAIQKSAGADVSVAGFVVTHLDFPDPLVRLAAMSALVHVASPSTPARELVVAKLQDADPGVRRAAVAALGKLRLGDPMAQQALEALAASADDDLGAIARRVLHA